jgi:hypothetical protein
MRWVAAVGRVAPDRSGEPSLIHSCQGYRATESGVKERLIVDHPRATACPVTNTNHLLSSVRGPLWKSP